jgi:hypothetical protein
VSLKPQIAGHEENKMSRSRSSKKSQPQPKFGEQEMMLFSLLQPLILATDIGSDKVVHDCISRGLLPISLVNAFEAIRFVSRTVLSAQRAQRAFGVPASVLMSIGMQECGMHDTSDLVYSESPNRNLHGSPVSNIDQWFIEKARDLATSAPLCEAIPLVDDVKLYVGKLCELGFCDRLDAQDILNNIDSFHLEECDIAAILPAGQYSNEIFRAVRDDAGCMQLKPVWDLRELRRMLTCASQKSQAALMAVQ